MHRFFIATAVALGAAGAVLIGSDSTSLAAEFGVRADKGGYIAGEAATVTVTGLTECANKTVSLGMRGAAGGAHFAAKDVTLDSEGSGSVRVALLTDNGGTPIHSAVWANCVNRGFEPGLAIDPHITLISVSFATEDELVAFLPSGAEPIARTVARGDVAAILRALTDGDVIQTGYPGDGGPLPHDLAVTQLRGMLVSGSGSDVYGVGRLGLLGAWQINGSFALLASGMGPDGARRVVALGVKETNGRWAVSSYGTVALSTGILETYAEQHQVRLGRIAPLSPATGNSLAASPGSGWRQPTAWISLAAAACSLLIVALLRRRNRAGRIARYPVRFDSLARLIPALVVSIFFATSAACDSSDPPGSRTASVQATATSEQHETFVATGDMLLPRSLHGTAVMPDGSIFVMGGNIHVSGRPPVTTSVERYVPKSGDFQKAGDLLEARQFFEPAVLKNGTVLVAGGAGNDGGLKTAEVWNPATGKSQAVSPLPELRTGFTAVVLADGRAMLMGGAGLPAGGLATTQIFDPATGAFSAGPTMNVARREPRALQLPDGTVLVVSDGSAERFSPTSNAFTMVSTANLPERPSLLPDGRVLLTGGPDLSEGAVTPTALEGNIRPATNRAVILDPASGVVAATGTMNEARLLHEAITLRDGRVLIAGGARTTHFDGGFVSSVEVFDPATGTFTLTGPMSAGRVWFSLVLLLDGSVLAIGDNGDAISSAEIWRP